MAIRRRLLGRLGRTLKFGERYYDPSIARWTQTDPIAATGIQQGNRYLYVGGDPINATDANGRSVCSFLSHVTIVEIGCLATNTQIQSGVRDIESSIQTAGHRLYYSHPLQTFKNFVNGPYSSSPGEDLKRPFVEPFE